MTAGGWDQRTGTWLTVNHPRAVLFVRDLSYLLTADMISENARYDRVFNDRDGDGRASGARQ